MTWMKSCLATMNLFWGLIWSVFSVRPAVFGSMACQSKPDQCSRTMFFIQQLFLKRCRLILAWTLYSAFLTSMLSCIFDIFDIFWHIWHISSWPGKGYKYMCPPPQPKSKTPASLKATEGAMTGEDYDLMLHCTIGHLAGGLLARQARRSQGRATAGASCQGSQTGVENLDYRERLGHWWGRRWCRCRRSPSRWNHLEDALWLSWCSVHVLAELLSITSFICELNKAYTYSRHGPIRAKNSPYFAYICKKICQKICRNMKENM